MTDHGAIRAIQNVRVDALYSIFKHTTVVEILSIPQLTPELMENLLTRIFDNVVDHFMPGQQISHGLCKTKIQGLRSELEWVPNDPNQPTLGRIRLQSRLVARKKATMKKYFNLGDYTLFFEPRTPPQNPNIQGPQTQERHRRVIQRNDVEDTYNMILHASDTGVAISSALAFQNNRYKDNAEYVSEKEQLRRCFDLLLHEKDQALPRGAQDFYRDFYSFVSPLCQTVLNLHPAMFPDALPETMFNGQELYTLLTQNSELRTATVAAAASDLDSDSDNNDEALTPTPAELMQAAVTAALSPSQHLVRELSSLLLSSPMTQLTHLLVPSSETLVHAAVASMIELRPSLEKMLWSVGCNAGTSIEEFRKTVHAPIQTLMRTLGLPLFRGALNYVSTNHPVYKKTLANCIPIHGGFTHGEGSHVNLLELIQESVTRSSAFVTQRYIDRGGVDKMVSVMITADAAWVVGHSTNQLQALLAKGKQQHTLISLGLAGNGCMCHHGRNLQVLGIYIGNDKQPFLWKHMAPHFDTIKKMNDNELTVTVTLANGDKEEWNAWITFPVDMSAAWSLKGTLLSKQGMLNNFNDWCHFGEWSHRAQIIDGCCFTHLPITFFKAALQPFVDALEDGENVITLGEWGTKYEISKSLPLNSLDRCSQSRFHGVATCVQGVFRSMFKMGHVLGTAENITKAVLDSTGYLLKYYVQNNRVVLQSGLTTGAWVAALHETYMDIAEKLIPDSLSDDPDIVKKLRDHLKSMLRDLTMNNAFVLSPHAGEWVCWKSSCRMYTALEIRWQMKLMVLCGVYANTITMRSRKFNLLEQMSVGADRFKLNVSEYMDEAPGEELHKLYHRIRKRIRQTGADLSSSEVAKIMSHMSMENQIRFDQAGGYDAYRKSNARRHAAQVTKAWRKDVNGVPFEQRMRTEATAEFLGVVERQGAASTLDPTDLDFLRKSSDEFDPAQTNVAQDEELNEDGGAGDGGAGDGGAGDGGGGGGGGGVGGYMQDDNSDEDSDDEPEDEDVLEDAEITRQMVSLNNEWGIKSRESATGYKAYGEVCCQGGSRYNSTSVPSGTDKEIEVNILRGKGKIKLGTKPKVEQIVIHLNTIDTIYIEENESSSEEDESEDDEDDESSDDDNDSSTSSSSSSSSSSSVLTKRTRIPSRKGKQHIQNKKRKVKKFKNHQVTRITFDLLTNATYENGVAKKKARAGGTKTTNSVDWTPPASAVKHAGRRIQMTLTTRRHRKTIANFKAQVIDMGKNVGNEKWRINVVHGAPPSAMPVLNTDKWKIRERDSKQMKTGSPIATAAAIEDMDERNIELRRLIAIMDKKDDQHYAYAQGQCDLHTHSATHTECPCCAVRIVLPRYQRVSGTFCKWSSFVSTATHRVYTSHMYCKDIGKMSQRMRNLWHQQQQDLNSNANEGEEDVVVENM